MKTRHIPKLSKPRIATPGATADAARRFISERIPEARIVGEGETADFFLIKPADFQELIEDTLAAIAYTRTRNQEFLPIDLVDQLLAGDNPVRVWRKYRGLTIDALVKKTGIARGYLSQIENGKRTGTVPTLAKVARALQVDLDDLTTRPAPDDDEAPAAIASAQA